MNVMTEY